jgi:formylglycine-generating enzyme required for sulfatase activity
MLIFRKLGSIALQQIAGDRAKDLVLLAENHLTDHSRRLTAALAQANERAWKTLEIALGGKRLWDRFASAEDKALREQVQTFLQSAVPGNDPDFLARCLKELREARDNQHLTTAGDMSPAALADDLGALGRFDDPEALLAAGCAAVTEIASELKRLGYSHLGRLLAVTPTRGQPLLAVAVQYYFRRAVAADEVLARELTWTRLGTVDRRLEDGFAFLAVIQERQAQALEEALDGLAHLEGVAVETRDAVFDVHADVLRLTDQFRLLRRELTIGHSVSYRDESERRLIEEVKRRYRALSDDQRRQFPQLGLDVSRLEIVAGDFPAALTDAREAAQRLGESRAKADAHHAAYRAALELRQWDEALGELQEAIAQDARYAPFPVHGHEVLSILGAGGFGVAFLCRNRYSGGRIVVKGFEIEGIDRDVAEVFREAQILESLRHPGIIRLLDCGFADPVREQRPFLKLEHFEGSGTLDEYVQKSGPLSPDDLLPIARQSAEALHAAHQAGVLHRDVKPANLLVRRTGRGWEVRLIDFGLSLRRSLVQNSLARGAAQGRSMVGSAVAGTLHYAAPEQLDPASSRLVGPHSDVFGFGRTCLFALFGNTRPRSKLIRALPDPWPDLVDDCCDEIIDNRPSDFGAVLERLKPASPTKPPEEGPQPEAQPEATRPSGPAQPVRKYTNSIGMTLVCIESGMFTMGSARDSDAIPHEVRITRPFFLGAHQVTQGQYQEVMGKNWSRFKGSADLPVEKVTWFDAVEFCNKLSTREKRSPCYRIDGTKVELVAGNGYRLPTEAEWEYACRAGSTGEYPFDGDESGLGKYAWYDRNSDEKTHPVGQKEPNAWGLYDMLGNVWEWCWDWYDADYYKKSPTEDPSGASSASCRVIRGGCWSNVAWLCRPAIRSRDAPEIRDSYLGFRVAAVQE